MRRTPYLPKHPCKPSQGQQLEVWSLTGLAWSRSRGLLYSTIVFRDARLFSHKWFFPASVQIYTRFPSILVFV